MALLEDLPVGTRVRCISPEPYRWAGMEGMITKANIPYSRVHVLFDGMDEPIPGLIGSGLWPQRFEVISHSLQPAVDALLNGPPDWLRHGNGSASMAMIWLDEVKKRMRDVDVALGRYTDWWRTAEQERDRA